MRGKRFVQEREKAIRLRKQGLSIRSIEKKLGINRSTLSSWFKNIILTEEKKDQLNRQWHEGLAKARSRAVAWHNTQKENRLRIAKVEAEMVLSKLNLDDRNIADLVLAMIYWGEGFKTTPETGMGNSDPVMLAVFLGILRKNYHIPVEHVRCELYLRADQDAEAEKKFWAKVLNLSMSNFRYVKFDKRTKGSKTRPTYHGVCALRCANVAIQRKLLNISKGFCDYIIKRS